jgi:quinol monooxygenase YgiN
MELLEVRVAVRVIVTQIAKAGKGEDMARAWSPRLPEVWSEPGCEQYEIFRSTTRPDVVVLMERWSTEADFDTHKKLNSTRGRVAPELRASVTRERYGYSVIGGRDFR